MFGGRNDQARSLTFGAYLTRQWLPGKQVVLAASTYAGYRRNVQRRNELLGLSWHDLDAAKATQSVSRGARRHRLRPA